MSYYETILTKLVAGAIPWMLDACIRTWDWDWVAHSLRWLL